MTSQTRLMFVFTVSGQSEVAANLRRNRAATRVRAHAFPLTGSERQNATCIYAACRFDIVPTGKKGGDGLISQLGLHKSGP